MEERERACDEEVLRTGGEPRVYAEGILKICELYLASPLACIAGVTGGDLKRRIEAIMSNRVGRRLNYAKKAALAVAATAAIVTPLVVGITSMPAIRAQSSSSAPSAPTPKFEVASIKQSASPVRGNAKIIRVEPGMLTIKGMSLKDLIQRAYGRGHSLQLSRSDLVSGGPKWCDADLYDIDAKPGGNPNGSGEDISEMLKALLADRFKLLLHHESKETPGYILVVETGGPKLKSRSPGDGGEPRIRGRSKRELQGGIRLAWRDVSMTTLSDDLGFNVLDRPVINRTGLTGT